MHRSPASTPRLLAFLVAPLLLAGCIERAPTPASRRSEFKRSSLGDVILTSVPIAGQSVGAVFGSAAELAGVDYSPAHPKPGDKVEVTFYYRALAEADEDYKVFVHIDAHGSQAARINKDHWPASGRYPTGVWRWNDVVVDRWSFNVPSSFDGDAFEIWTGFYQPGKDERWPLTNRGSVQNDGQNRVRAVSIPVR
jgi:hypothetical protein